MVASVRVCLLLLSTVIALTTEGLPVNRRMMPSPLWNNKPTTLFYPHRKLSRPWLIKIQEELWKESPSGDGPDDDIKSSSLSSAKYRTYTSENAYKTHTPSLEDFISEDEELFPTVIDTMIEESPDYRGELVSRTSMPYEGPSSLLNSFIFRPSVPLISPSSIKTPFIEESEESQYPYLSWLENSFPWTTNAHQAVSEEHSDQMIIVTAISATHIYSESDWMFLTNFPRHPQIPPTDPSETYSNPSISFNTQRTLLTTKTANLTEVPSSTNVQMSSLDSNKNQFHASTDNDRLTNSYQSGYLYSFEEIHQSSKKSQIFLSLSNVSVSSTQTYFYSENLSRIPDVSFLTLSNYSNDIGEKLFPNLTPSISSYRVINDSAELSSEQYQIDSLIQNSTFLVNPQIFYYSNSSLYTTTLHQSFLPSNIQTTVTIVENKINTDRFVMPTFTIHGTSTSLGANLGSFYDAAFSTSNSKVVLDFPEIASSFTEVEDNIPVISLWPLDVSSDENIISQEDAKTFLQDILHSEEIATNQHDSERKSRDDYTTVVYPIFSSINLPLSDNDIIFGRRSSSSEFPEFEISPAQTSTLITPLLQSLARTYIPPIEQILTTFLHSTTFMKDIPSSVNEIETDKPKINISSLLKASVSLIENDTLLVLTKNASPIASSVLHMSNFSFQILSTRALTYVNDKSQQEMTSTVTSVPQIISTNGGSLEKELLPTQHGSAEEFIDPSTHHVTVRSLSDDSVIESSDSLLQSYAASTDSDIKNEFTSIHISLAVITPLASPKDITLEEEILHSQTDVDNKFSSTDLESTFPLYENQNFTTINNISYDNFRSQVDKFDSGTISFVLSQTPTTDYISLTDNQYTRSTSLFPVDSSHLLYSTFIDHEDSDNQNYSKDNLISSTELLPETANPTDSIDLNISDSLLKTTYSRVMKSSQLESTKELEDSHILYNVSSINDLSIYDGVFPLIYANRTVSQDNEQTNEQSKSTVDLGSLIKPSKTVSQFEYGSNLEIITPIYPLLENSFLNITESKYVYLKSSMNFEETQIESSIILQHSNNVLESTKSLEDIFASKSTVEGDTLFQTHLETVHPTKTIIYSSEFYPNLSEDSKFLLPNNYTVTFNETHISSYLLTLTVPWKISKHILDYSLPSPATDNYISSYTETLDNGNYVTKHSNFQDTSLSTILGLSSSKEVSFGTYDYSYETEKDTVESLSSFSLDEKSPSTEIISSLIIENSISAYSYILSSSPLLITNFISKRSSFPISSTNFIDNSESFMSSTFSRFQDVVEKEIYPSESDNFQEFSAFSFTNSFFHSTAEITPSKPMDLYTESSCLISSCPVFLYTTPTPDLVTAITEDSYLSPKTEPVSSMVLSSFTDSQKMFDNSLFILNLNLSLQNGLKTAEIVVHSKIINSKMTEPNISTFKPEITSTASELPVSKIGVVSKETAYPAENPEPEYPHSTYSIVKIESKSTESDYSIKITEHKILDSTLIISKTESESIESEYPIKIQEPQSVESAYTKMPESQSVESHYSTRKPESQSMQFDYSTRKPEPHSIESEFPVRKPDPKSIQSDYFTKKVDPKSIESGYPQSAIHATKSTITNITFTSLQAQSTSYSIPRSTKVPLSETKRKESSMLLATPATGDIDLSRKWLKESSTPGYGVEMASVLAISSFFGTNSSRTAGSTFENSGISESDWSKTEVSPTPSLDLTLFKDDHYWILSVLEAPAKGHLPENFSHTMETRLANAYSEAFRRRDGKKGPYGPEDKVEVKILSLTNDLLLNQLNIVYVVERGGTLVPASVASEYLNFLRHEQLREFLGLYAILKAKPYRPSEMTESRPVPSPIPVVTIVCSILGFLLLVFCCFCVYCRCCRPKQAADASPTSSAGGSLQRSLEKHGQHNRKHLFQEMTHKLTTELASHKKQHESTAPDIYMPEKELLPGKKLPPLPPTLQAETLDRAMKMLKILENKDASTSPIVCKHADGTDRSDETDGNGQESKRIPKPKRRRKTKESQEKSSEEKVTGDDTVDRKRTVHPDSRQQKGGIALPSEVHRKSPDSGTSSRHTSSTLTSVSEKLTEEGGSDGSHTELLPPLQDLIAKSKADSEAAAADTQIHLSRVRQRIAELLDDAFALAGGRKFYGSLRSKKVEPTADVFPRYASLRSQSAAEYSQARHEESNSAKDRQRPISEGGQQLLGVITDDGQLITRPPPKLVWDPDLQNINPDDNRLQEVTEAHNRHINFFPFQQQSKLQQISASSTSSLPVLDTLHESQVNINASTSSTTNVLREAASEVYLAHSSKIHPAAIDQYDEIDVVNALREGEPVAALIQAIKDELTRFSGSLPGTNNESNA